MATADEHAEARDLADLQHHQRGARVHGQREHGEEAGGDSHRPASPVRPADGGGHRGEDEERRPRDHDIGQREMAPEREGEAAAPRLGHEAVADGEERRGHGRRERGGEERALEGADEDHSPPAPRKWSSASAKSTLKLVSVP